MTMRVSGREHHKLDTAATCVARLEWLLGPSQRRLTPRQRAETQATLHDLRKAIMSGKRLTQQITRAKALIPEGVL